MNAHLLWASHIVSFLFGIALILAIYGFGRIILGPLFVKASKARKAVGPFVAIGMLIVVAATFFIVRELRSDLSWLTRWGIQIKFVSLALGILIASYFVQRKS